MSPQGMIVAYLIKNRVCFNRYRDVLELVRGGYCSRDFCEVLNKTGATKFVLDFRKLAAQHVVNGADDWKAHVLNNGYFSF